MENKTNTIVSILYSKAISFIILFILLLSTCSIKDNQPLITSFYRLSVMVFMIILFFNFMNFKLSKFSIVFVFYTIILSLVTYFSTFGNLKLVFHKYFKIMAIILYLDLGIKKYTINTLFSLSYSLLILNIINFYTIIMYPSGWYSSELYDNNWFFGYDNTHIFMYFASIISFYLYRKAKNDKFNIFETLMICIITYNVFFCFSANSVVAYTIFLIYILLKKQIDKIEFMNSKTYFIIFLLIFVFIVLLRVQNLFEWLIVGVLHKDLTFTNRVKIWDMIITLIKEKPLFGYGLEPVEVLKYKLRGPFTHAHNTILDVMYKCGIAGIIPFLSMIIFSVKELYKNKENVISRYCSIILFCLLIMMNFEAREDKIGLYIVLVLCFNIKTIISYTNNKEESGD